MRKSYVKWHPEHCSCRQSKWLARSTRNILPIHVAPMYRLPNANAVTTLKSWKLYCKHRNTKVDQSIRSINLLNLLCACLPCNNLPFLGIVGNLLDHPQQTSRHVAIVTIIIAIIIPAIIIIFLKHIPLAEFAKKNIFNPLLGSLWNHGKLSICKIFWMEPGNFRVSGFRAACRGAPMEAAMRPWTPVTPTPADRGLRC